jgi:hypothetical protein
MKGLYSLLIAILLVATTVTAADNDKSKQEQRLQNAGQVLSEILNVPEDIPQDL